MGAFKKRLSTSEVALIFLINLGIRAIAVLQAAQKHIGAIARLSKAWGQSNKAKTFWHPS
jgi:hypothetical protein